VAHKEKKPGGTSRLFGEKGGGREKGRGGEDFSDVVLARFKRRRGRGYPSRHSVLGGPISLGTEGRREKKKDRDLTFI